MSETEDKTPQQDSSQVVGPVKGSQMSGGWVGYVVAAGIVLPIIAVVFELMVRLCSFFFDPVPTPGHIALLSTVPISSALTLLVCRRAQTRYVVAVTFLVGLAAGTGVVYSLQFLPISPFSVIAIVAYGVGLLGLSPFLGLAASVMCARRLALVGSTESRRRRTVAFYGGAAFGVVALGLYIVGGLVTAHGLEMAGSDDPAVSRKGVQLIRTFGSKTALLRACYELPPDMWASMLSSGSARAARADARTTYYKVTGDSFNSVPPPAMALGRMASLDDFELDSDVGGTAVNGVVRKLSLQSSRIDANVESAALTSYCEWTMVFRNRSAMEREARAEIALPPGGVVSRLTLWVNGEEREAAFSSRGKVRQAYEKVAVVQRRDPVLVTTCGPDRILMQCFPVPADGGTMKVRVGITAPLMPQRDGRALFVMPRFVEHNFGVRGEGLHSVYVRSDSPVASDGGATSRTLRASWSDAELDSSKAVLWCFVRKDAGRAWCPDLLEPERYAVVQSLEETSAALPKRLVIVVDGSRRMADMRDEIAEGIRALPRGCEFSVLQAADDVTVLSRMRRATPEAVDEAADAVRRMSCAGGVDNGSALLEAVDAAAGRHGVVLWIHGPQPLDSEPSTEALLQSWERRPGALRLASMAATEGQNAILSELDRTGAVIAVPRLGTLSSDIKRMFADWSGGLVVARRRVPLSEAVGTRASGHVARLWTRDEVTRLMQAADSRRIPDASVLAAKSQIVTAISGAVVLENEQQYKDAGLKAVDPASVPSTVPEPASWVALGLGVAGLLGRRRMLRGRVRV